MVRKGSWVQVPHRASVRGLAAISAALALALPAIAAAKGPDPFAVGFGDGLLSTPNAETRALWQDRAVDAGGSLVRVNVEWSRIATAPPADPSNPADPAYDFATLDAAVVDARARGLEVMLTVFSAPAFAEADRPAGVSAAPGTYKPDPAALGDFATALAARYSGFHVVAGARLPRVASLQAWLEPNLPNYLTPQWKQREPVSPDHYRKMLAAFYVGAKRGSKAVNVVGAGTAPYGDDPGGLRMRPLRFWRLTLCLTDDLRPDRGCRRKNGPARFDVFAHHPINTSGGPDVSALHPDDATGADLREVIRVLRAGERAGSVSPGGRHEFWATEFWWESDPPDQFDGYAPERQARYIAETLFQVWEAGGSAAFLLQIRDDAYDPARPSDSLQSGVYGLDGTAKPALQAVRFPFVVESRRRGALAWGIAPRSGRIEILTGRGEPSERVATVSGKAGSVFTVPIDSSRGSFQARLGNAQSLAYELKR